MDRNRQLNHEAYRQMRESIKKTYAPNRFLAIAGGQIVADADKFQVLRDILVAQGKEPAQVLIVRAGIDYPEMVDIFAQVSRQ